MYSLFCAFLPWSDLSKMLKYLRAIYAECQKLQINVTHAFIQFLLLVQILKDHFQFSSTFSRLEASSSINTSGDVLTFTDLSGVFYCVLFGMASSLLVLLVELLIEAHKDTKQNHKEVIQYSFNILVK